jgi:hypothetical protein
MPLFWRLIGEKAGIFALFKTIFESITSPKPSPVGEGAEPARRMRCLLSNVYVFFSIAILFYIWGKANKKPSP